MTTQFFRAYGQLVRFWTSGPLVTSACAPSFTMFSKYSRKSRPPYADNLLNMVKEGAHAEVTSGPLV